MSMLQFWEFSYKEVHTSVKYIQDHSSFLQWRSRSSRPCWSPRQPHPRHRYSQELVLGTGDAAQLRAKLDFSEVKKTNRFFDTLNLVQTVFSNQIHGTSRQDRAWKGSALLYCEDRQSKSTFISIVSIEI